MDTKDIIANVRDLFKKHFTIQEQALDHGITYDLYGTWEGSTSFNERSGCMVTPIDNNAVERLYVKSGALSATFFPAVASVKHAMKELVVPKNHDISYFNLFFVIPSLSESEVKMIKSTRVRHSYALFFKGSSALRIVAIDGENERIVTNGDGKYFAKRFTPFLLKKRHEAPHEQD